MAPKTVPLARYLFTRLGQLGCHSLHGLPGDFNLLALDHVEPAGIKWVGSCNELNAAYAADAYARVRGLGALITTFGVGELSAVNGIAGSYAEIAPVVHIVGTPNRAAQEGKKLLHHTLGNGDFGVFARIHAQITIAQANLTDLATAPAEIDRVLRTCYVESRPVYIQLPTDMVTLEVDASFLDTPIDVSHHTGDLEAEEAALQLILQKLYAATRPVVLVDAEVEKRRLISSTDALLRKLNIPVFVAPMGKGSVDETLLNFVGVYSGEGPDHEISQIINTSDLVLTIGSIKSDLNTSSFSYQYSRLDAIDFHYDHIVVGAARFEEVYFKSAIPRFTELLDSSKLQPGATELRKLTQPAPETADEYGEDVITHKWLWPRMSSWLQIGDLVVCDTGTSYVGSWEIKLPKDVQIIDQLLWSSIGYGVGAAQGAGLAAKDNGRGQRTICFEGDGSFQLTAQELSTIIHHDLNVTIFLIENNGYTIERFVHGLEAYYNDIPQWQYHKLPEMLTPVTKATKPKSWRIESKAEFEKLLQSHDFVNGKGLQFCEIHMPKLDAPATLKAFGKKAEKTSS